MHERVNEHETLHGIWLVENCIARMVVSFVSNGQRVLFEVEENVMCFPAFITNGQSVNQSI